MGENQRKNHIRVTSRYNSGSSYVRRKPVAVGSRHVSNINPTENTDNPIKFEAKKIKKIEVTETKKENVELINTQFKEVPNNSTKNKDRGKKQTEDKRKISEHISELRQRTIWCVFALIIGGLLGWKLQDRIIDWLVKPLNQQLFYTTPAGGFDFLIKLCLFVGFLLAVPVIIYNFMKFISPALPSKVSFKTSKIIVTSIVLALLGIGFAYYISLPAALHFLNQFTNQEIQSLISAQEYFNFVMIYMAGFALLFQMPLVMALINKITPLTPSMLIQKQRIIILVSFIVAAVLTPTPDPINQSLMAFPMIGLYQASIGVVWQENNKSKRKAKKSSIKFNQQPAMA